MRTVAEDGFAVLPGVLAPDLVAAAARDADALVAAHPPAADTRGPHFVFTEPTAAIDAVLDVALAHAGTLTTPLARPGQVQIARNIPPFPHRPGRPHIDGAHDNSGPPGTFTLLAGVFLTDETADDHGNLWAWPGTHRTHAGHFAARGPEAFWDHPGYPDVDLPHPVVVHGKPGDLLLAHYLLGHNIGGNTAPTVRTMLYFRLRTVDHDWRAALCDADHGFR